MYEKVKKIIEERQNVFLSGAGGVGKSWILNKLAKEFPDMVITSTTGISAMAVGGQTIHSWAGIGIGSRPVDVIVSHIKNRRQVVYNNILNCDWLAIDEISMMDGKLLDYLDAVFKKLRNSTRPFGGITLIVIGDMAQLPPVKKENGYAFESKVWQEANFVPIILTEVKRQTDIAFITALNNARFGTMTDKDVSLFKSREILLGDTPENEVLRIFSKNVQANEYNIKKINEIPKEPTIFEAVEHGNSPDDLAKLDKDCRAPKTLMLKVGCRVMLVKNLDFYSGFVNGACGVVKDISRGYIDVLFDNGIESSIKKEDFEIEKDNKVIAKRTQFPLRLAYGITIHKSQGMSLDSVRVNLNNIFSAGQAYVALSRARTLEGLYLVGFNSSKIYADPKIIEFYDRLANPPEVKAVQQTMELNYNAIPRVPEKPKHKTVSDILLDQQAEIDNMISPVLMVGDEEAIPF